VVGVTPPADDASVTANRYAAYDIEYSFSSPQPKLIELHDEVLKDGHFSAGASWDATYVVKIGVVHQPPYEGLLLTKANPINFVCDWTPAPVDASSESPPHVDRGAMFKDYFTAGVHHILTGYDHLLFISALVLAAVSLWDLVKVVTAFTLAHTITLTLAALNLVHVSERISEPLISLSIVFIALQNVFWPRQSNGWIRLGAAFFFGLFHGLGFAGGLLENMRGLHGATVLTAILAFSVGVEAGHQMIVLPLFAGLKLARSTQASDFARERLRFAALRVGSAVISLAGLWFLVLAMKLCITGHE